MGGGVSVPQQTNEVTASENDTTEAKNIGVRGSLLNYAKQLSTRVLDPMTEVDQRLSVKIPVRNVGLRSSVLMMTKLIKETVPTFTLYTDAEVTVHELDYVNIIRIKLGGSPTYLEFYTAVYTALNTCGRELHLFNKGISFKNTLLIDLMRVVVMQAGAGTMYVECMQSFAVKYKCEGITIQECESLQSTYCNTSNIVAFICSLKLPFHTIHNISHSWHHW